MPSERSVVVEVELRVFVVVMDEMPTVKSRSMSV